MRDSVWSVPNQVVPANMITILGSLKNDPRYFVRNQPSSWVRANCTEEISMSEH